MKEKTRILLRTRNRDTFRFRYQMHIFTLATRDNDKQ